MGELLVTKPLLAHEKPYEDTFIRIDDKGIHIKWYYFPIAATKLVKWEHIAHVDVIDSYHHNMPLFKSKNWGIALSPIWWSCDMSRGLSSNPDAGGLIVVAIDSWPAKGVSIEPGRMTRALEVIRFYDPNVIRPVDWNRY